MGGNISAVITSSKSSGLLLQGGGRCGKSSDFWNNYEADIARVAALNSNSFRLSLEWSRIEPNQGQTCPEGVERYHAIFECLKRFAAKKIYSLPSSSCYISFTALGSIDLVVVLCA